MKILYISPRVPFPPTDGGAIVTYNTVTEAAKAGHEVHLLAVNTPKHFQTENAVPYIHYQKYVFVDTGLSVLKAFINLFKNTSFNIERFISPDFEKALLEILKNNMYDIIQFEGAYVAWYVDLVRKHSGSPLLLRAHNIEYTIWRGLAENSLNPMKKAYLKLLAQRLESFEKEYYPRFDGIAAISAEDAGRLKDMGIKAPCQVIPAAVSIDNPVSEIIPKPFTLFMISSLDWIPNQEALIWFLDNIWAALIQELPQLELHIAGKNTPDHLSRIKTENVVMHGFVNSAAEFMQQHDLMLVPLRSGGGMRVKIIEGMALGKTIIASSLGAEGIHYEDGKNILIAEKPEDWIRKILDYFRNKASYAGIAENARRLVAAEYSKEKISKDFIGFYRQLIAEGK